MGMLVDGTWFDDDPPPDRTGRFVRPDSLFRDRVTRDGASGLQGRTRPLSARHRAVMPVGAPHRADAQAETARKRDPAARIGPAERPGLGLFARLRRAAAEETASSTSTRSIPPPGPITPAAPPCRCCGIGRRKTIVNNESSEIIRMLNSEFDEFGDAALDLYPTALRRDIDEINAFVYDNINNGVYRAGLAKSQAAYEEAFNKLFAALDELETRLGKQRWLVGDRFTEADLRLFPTLLRFDTVYYVLFKCNLRRLTDYHNLWNYTREIYQMPGVAETVDFARIKLGYYGGMRHINPTGILPLGPDLDFAAPHDRARGGQTGLEI